MNAEICFYRETEGDYDVITGEGDEGGVAVFWRGNARVQHLRAPRTFEAQEQPEATRFFRFQIDPGERAESLPFMPEGVKARVIHGGRDSHLESLVFVTNSAINSSHMAVRTVELESNMKFVDWQWNPDGPSYGLFPSDGLYPAFTLFPIQ